MPKRVLKSAETGEFVSKEELKNHPEMNYEQQVHPQIPYVGFMDGNGRTAFEMKLMPGNPPLLRIEDVLDLLNQHSLITPAMHSHIKRRLNA